uniref:Reverse transcriptase domain-containing protein n=1 Tax=Cannabis sativa TaxID=3483 RepID=A0A803P447_CANSA
MKLNSFRVKTFNKESNEKAMAENMDLFEERRNIAQIRTGESVLRKVLPNTRDPRAGVLGANWEGPYRIAKVIPPRTYKLARMDKTVVPRAWNAGHLRKYHC